MWFLCLKIPRGFYYDLEEKNIGNEYKINVPATSRGGRQQSVRPPTFSPVAHATPTKRKRKESTDSCYTDKGS